ncbi:hypothetical protein B0T26DRAFT_212577 [Lasiosphaeria miniovina]|uniref:Transmembrane protein n=1 Tax=Lasiosphaeria miniovina TaxID=1954250 RepID=A0AA40DZH1_9PEZI|nr:uncharacterized protein B0T26DRAFT_212577 [Lasiosphaeria miniovina]KAK0722314.1 hypothetical protein B0T26DRAFT_212577 [Lasiosphaeria miniovina]
MDGTVAAFGAGEGKKGVIGWVWVCFSHTSLCCIVSYFILPLLSYYYPFGILLFWARISLFFSRGIKAGTGKGVRIGPAKETSKRVKDTKPGVCQ